MASKGPALAPPSLSADLQQQLKLLSTLHPEVPEPEPVAPASTAATQPSSAAAAADLEKASLSFLLQEQSEPPPSKEPVDLQAFVQKALNGASTPLGFRPSMQPGGIGQAPLASAPSPGGFGQPSFASAPRHGGLGQPSFASAVGKAQPPLLGMTQISSSLAAPLGTPSAAVALQAAPSKTGGLRPLAPLGNPGLPSPGLPSTGSGLPGLPPFGSTGPGGLSGLPPLSSPSLQVPTARGPNLGLPLPQLNAPRPAAVTPLPQLGASPLLGSGGGNSDTQSIAAKAMLLQQLRTNSSASNAGPGGGLLAQAHEILNKPKEPSLAATPGGDWAAKAAAYSQSKTQADQKLAAVQAIADAAAAARVPDVKAPPLAPAPTLAPPPLPGQPRPGPPGLAQAPPPGAPARISPELVAQAAALALAKGGKAGQPGGPQIIAPPPGANPTISPDLVKAAAALAIAKGLPAQPGAPVTAAIQPAPVPGTKESDERLKQLALMTEPGGGAGGSGFSGSIESAVERMNRKREERFASKRSRSRRRREPSRGRKHTGRSRERSAKQRHRSRSRGRRGGSRDRRGSSRGRGR